MMRALFVDDEPQLLDGLRRMLRPFRNEWEMRFVSSGEEALQALEESPVDVVVSDMRMPGMDGAALLREVRDRYPDVIRIVLSGHAELASVLAVVNVAHQFLSKPCLGESLTNAVKRCCNVRERLTREPLRRVANAIGTLPPAPGSYAALVRALENPAVTLHELAAIVEEDVAMCAKVLQLANSVVFGATHRVTTVADAIKSLGTNLLKVLVLSAELFHWSEHENTVLDGFSLEALQRHSLLTARIAMQLPDDKLVAEDAFTAGMLHDIGRLMLAVRRSEDLASVLATCAAEHRPLHVVEAELLGTTHADLGGYLLGAWGLPTPIVEAVAFHHTPSQVQVQRIDVLTAVHVADQLARRHAPCPTEDHDTEDGIAEELLARLGVADRLPAWEAMAAKLAGSAH